MPFKYTWKLHDKSVYENHSRPQEHHCLVNLMFRSKMQSSRTEFTSTSTGEKIRVSHICVYIPAKTTRRWEKHLSRGLRHFRKNWPFAHCCVAIARIEVRSSSLKVSYIYIYSLNSGASVYCNRRQRTISYYIKLYMKLNLKNRNGTLSEAVWCELKLRESRIHYRETVLSVS